MFKLLCVLMFFLPILLRADVVTAAVAHIYVQPREGTEIDSQALYGSVVELLSKNPNGWSQIRTSDGVTGWVLSSQLTHNPSFETSSSLRPVKSLFAHIYRTSDLTVSPPLLTLPYGARVALQNGEDPAPRWIAIYLASGEKAWIQRADVDFAPQTKTVTEIVEFGKKFIGLPYTWGGTSSYGFDCSGFAQMLYREMGLSLPRNARDQMNSPLLIQVTQEELQPGDLIFFGTTKVTHVGLYLGHQEYLHAGASTAPPQVKINRLDDGAYIFYSARRVRS
jgi:hypothetical protein